MRVTISKLIEGGWNRQPNRGNGKHGWSFLPDKRKTPFRVLWVDFHGAARLYKQGYRL